MTTPALSVIVPVPSPDADVSVAIRDVGSQMEALGVPAEIIVAGRDLERLSAEISRVRARVAPAGDAGFGSALRAGLEAAAGDYIVTIDAESGNPSTAVFDLWNSRREGEIVVASRYVAGARTRMSVPRRVASRAINAMFGRGLSLPVTDLSSPFQMYRGDVLREQRLNAHDYDLLPEILVRALAGGWHVREIPLRVDLARRVLSERCGSCATRYRRGTTMPGRTTASSRSSVTGSGSGSSTSPN
jgi:glycosyltransferase involved in cell wall biosynthesis